jgi:hypothetical protein
MDGARVPSTAYALHLLGQKLMWIADGQEATKVFGQDKSGRAGKTERDSQIARIYWAARASGDHSRERGVKAVRSNWPGLKLADSALHDIAKRYKNVALDALEFEDIINQTSGIDAVADIKRRTARKDGKGNAEWQAGEVAERAAKARPLTHSERKAMRDVLDEIKRRNKRRTTLVLKK